MAKVKQTFEYAPPLDSPFIEYHVWAKKSLNKEEYAQWIKAVDRQSALRQKAIDAGYLIYDLDNDAYIWDEEWTIGKKDEDFKEYDHEWVSFWERYLKETGIEFSSHKEIIE